VSFRHSCRPRPARPWSWSLPRLARESRGESALSEHERGAFTGAQESQIGAFEEARDGTVLLDEIGDMEQGQGKLLRVLESRTFRRLGSSREIPLRARVVAAYHQDLSAPGASGPLSPGSLPTACGLPDPHPALARTRGRHSALGGALPHPSTVSA